MSETTSILAPGGSSRHAGPVSRFTRIFNGIENGVVVATLAAMVLLPLLEIVLRKLGSRGISGSSAFVQHGSLVVGMIGGALAARQDRLLSLATSQFVRGGWWASAIRLIAHAAGATVSAALCLASIQFVREERESQRILAYGIPVWIIELVLPIGFALIALRLLRRSSDRWGGVLIATAMSALLLGLFSWTSATGARVAVPALVGLLLFTALGMPIFAVLGGAALILFRAELSPIASISVDHYRLVVNPLLPAMPLFTLAGYVLAAGGASRRLVEVFTALFGSVPGGAAIVVVLVCAFFTTFTGASGVTILALGGLLLPILLSSGYGERPALGLVTGAGALGMLFPPCLPLILYAIIAKLPVQDIFLAAIVPGALLVVLTAILGVWMGPRRSNARPKFHLRPAALAVWHAKWELLLPVVALVALFGGFATLLEAAAVTALYAFISQTLLNRDLNILRDIPRVMVECGLVIGGVLLILGVAQGLTNYLIFAEIPDHAMEWVTRTVQSRFAFLLLLNLALLVVGGLMDVYSAIVVVVPLLIPIGEAFGIDPLHLGIIFLANLELGFLTPPVGVNLFLAGYRFGKPLPQVFRAIIPLLGIQLLGVLLITYVPPLTHAGRWLFDRLPSLPQ